MTELPKTFDPAAIEQRWYAHWEANGLFRPERPDAEPWTIVMPPPNVTGTLHIGHALDNTLAGHPDAPCAAAGQGCAVGGRHRPCRHRDADGGRAQAGRARQQKRTDLTPRCVRRAVSGNGRRSPAARSRASCAASALVRLGERALHDGRGLFRRRHQGVRRPPQTGAALSRQAAGELGSRASDRDQRSRGRDAARSRASSGT